MKNFTTLTELLSFQAAKYHNLEALAYKKDNRWQYFSNQDFLKKCFHFACGLKENGFQKGQTIAIFSYQNPLWLIADLGSILAGGITVSIFSNISDENFIYEISDSNSKYIFTDNVNIQNILHANQKNDLTVITNNIDKINQENFYDFEEFLSMGAKAAAKYNLNEMINSAKMDDLATIIYTSGSTGKPKGVELTHQNLVSQIMATKECFPLNSDNDKALSFLPLAHIFERMVMMFYISQGIKICFCDDIKNLGNLLLKTNPTLMTVVPRMLEKVYAKICEGVENKNILQKFLGKIAIKRALEKDPDYKANFLDKIFNLLIYKKFRAALGKNMHMIICGGSHLSNEMERFFSNIGVNLYCGYGLTETSPVLAANCPKAHKFGTVGKSFPLVELKISNDDELLAKGPNIMRGYHNDLKRTQEVFKDGWFCTGDLAKIDEEGFLTITGRKKELFKTANGKYVRPVALEQKLMQEIKFLSGAIIIAEGRKFTSALLFADFEQVEKYKNKLKFFGSIKEFLQSQILHDYLDQIIHKINQNFDHAEQIQKFAIIDQEISIAGGQITPSMKLKRNVLEEEFKDVIDSFYQEN